MPGIACPFCTRLGTGLVATGLLIVTLGALLYLPLLLTIGIILIVLAYIVPSMMASRGRLDATCTTTPPNQQEQDDYE